jgi:perosamine synthetase
MYEGATPVFADVDPDTLNLDVSAVEAAVTERTKAVVAVDIFGYPCELDPLRELCDRHDLTLIEDACEALGAEYKGRPLGSHGHLAVFAFYPNKQMTTGEGGMVVTGSEEQWRLLKSLSNQGRAEDGSWLEHERFGFNYRLDDIASAIGIAQLEKFDQILDLRGRVAARYASLLAEVDGFEPLLADDDDHKRSWFVYPVRLAPSIDRERVRSALAQEGIDTKVYLPSIHLQPYMRERFGFREGMFPVSEAASQSLLSVPFHTALDAEDQECVVEALRAAS